MAYQRSGTLVKQIVSDKKRHLRLGYSKCEMFRDAYGNAQGFAHIENKKVFFITYNGKLNLELINRSVNHGDKSDFKARRVMVTLARNYRLTGELGSPVVA